MFNKSNSQVIRLENKIPSTIRLNHLLQYDSHKQTLGKKTEDFGKKY